MKKIFLFIVLFSSLSLAQSTYTQEDIEICNNKFEIAVSESLSTLPIGDVVADIGKTFLGLKYEAFTLEAGDTESVVVHLTGLDCYTFYETSLALARCVKMGKYDFDSYLKEIENLRYRNGKMEGYVSRLHYAVDWLYDNQKRGHIKDITKEIGGERLIKKVDFMSTHPDLYKRLKNNPGDVQKIAAIEEEINNRKYYYIPQDKIEDAEPFINTGDLIYATTNQDGLMVGHTGIAVKLDDGRIHFMHAPLVGSKVQISEKTLPDYIKAVKKHTGIMVLRVLEPAGE